MRRFFWLVLACLFTACATLPSERSSVLEQKQQESVAAATTTDIVDRTVSSPAPVEVTLPQKGADPVVVKVPAVEQTDRHVRTTVQEDSSYAAQGTTTTSFRLPRWVSAIGWALAILLLLLVGWLLLRASVSLRTAWQVGDEFLARGINHVRGLAQASNDAKESATLNSIVSQLEQVRADFNKD